MKLKTISNYINSIEYNLEEIKEALKVNKDNFSDSDIYEIEQRLKNVEKYTNSTIGIAKDPTLK